MFEYLFFGVLRARHVYPVAIRCLGEEVQHPGILGMILGKHVQILEVSRVPDDVQQRSLA